MHGMSSKVQEPPNPKTKEVDMCFIVYFTLPYDFGHLNIKELTIT